MLTTYWKNAIANDNTEEFEQLLRTKYPLLVPLATSNNPIYRGYLLELEHLCFGWNIVQATKTLSDGVVPPRIAAIFV